MEAKPCRPHVPGSSLLCVRIMGPEEGLGCCFLLLSSEPLPNPNYMAFATARRTPCLVPFGWGPVVYAFLSSRAILPFLRLFLTQYLDLGLDSTAFSNVFLPRDWTLCPSTLPQPLCLTLHGATLRCCSVIACLCGSSGMPKVRSPGEMQIVPTVFTPLFHWTPSVYLLCAFLYSQQIPSLSGHACL